MEDQGQLNLLDLPDEVLEKIIYFLPDKNTIALVCLKLYSLVCECTKDENLLEISHSELICPETIASIKFSQKKFKDLVINLSQCDVVDFFIFEKIETVIQKFGPRLKRLKLWNSIQAKNSEINEEQLCVILENVPLLEEFIFKNVYVKQSRGILKDVELNLKNLRSLVLDYCLFDTPNVLLKLPRDVICDLTFTFELPDEREFQEFFNRQSKIKKLEIFENDQLNFSHLQLHHLKISSDCNFPLLIQQQPQLKFLDFAITWTTDETFEEVCKLKNLEVLRTLVDLISNRVFKGLQEMPKLRELRLDSHSSYDMGYLQELSLMKGMRLEKLTFLFNERKISPEVVIQMANNFQFLKEVEIINKSIAILNTLIQNFPSLESIVLDYFAVFGAPSDNLVVSNDELQHVNLKQLVVTHVNINEEENTRMLRKIIRLCPNLERLMLSKLCKFGNEELLEDLTFLPKLTHLSIDTDETLQFNEDIVPVIAEKGRKLIYLQLKGFKVCQLSYKEIKNTFKLQFQVVNMFKYSSDEIELIMKKKNTKDYHLSFKLMDHF